MKQAKTKISARDLKRIEEIDKELDIIWDKINEECDKNENYDREKYRELRYKESRLLAEYNKIMDKYNRILDTYI